MFKMEAMCICREWNPLYGVQGPQLLDNNLKQFKKQLVGMATNGKSIKGTGWYRRENAGKRTW
jgi:hypothetical protein